MMSNIFVEVCEQEQQFEHPVTLLGIGLTSSFFEVLDDGQRIGQQPFQVRWLHRSTFAAAIKRIVGSLERFVEKMIKA
jgi:hypothetical protein